MCGRKTPKPLQSSPLCGWPELSTGKKWELVMEHARSAEGVGVVWGFFVTLCRNTHRVILTGVLT